MLMNHDHEMCIYQHPNDTLKVPYISIVISVSLHYVNYSNVCQVGENELTTYDYCNL